jgi:hypothetical protein
MPESKPSEPAPARDYSVAYFWSGVSLVSIGAGLFHPGAGLMLAGLALAFAGMVGGPPKKRS